MILENCETTSSITIHSGNKFFAELLKAYLDNMELSKQAPIDIILDAPWGFAFSVSPKIANNKTITITDNSCGEYHLDLLDLNPMVLIAKPIGLDDIKLAIEMVATGNSFQKIPNYQSPLTKTERKALQLCALNGDIKQVAKSMRISSGTLRNCLSEIYFKLDLDGMSDLALYYFNSHGFPDIVTS